MHVRCAVDVNDVGRPVRVTVAGQVWTVEAATLSPARRTWGLRRPARWYVSFAGVPLELYAREYRPGAPGLTWWWLVLPATMLAPLNLHLIDGGRGVAPLEKRCAPLRSRRIEWLGC